MTKKKLYGVEIRKFSPERINVLRMVDGSSDTKPKIDRSIMEVSNSLKMLEWDSLSKDTLFKSLKVISSTRRP
jgi:DUF4097 and DUF4098 domain-containing protein YvlB